MLGLGQSFIALHLETSHTVWVLMMVLPFESVSKVVVFLQVVLAETSILSESTVAAISDAMIVFMMFSFSAALLLSIMNGWPLGSFNSFFTF